MGLTITQSISALTVFVQGLLSFFSPCVLPLIPLYLGYLAGGGKHRDDQGNTVYNRGIILRNTVFFVLGISFALFLLGLGFSAAGQFFRKYETAFNIVCGVIVILFGLYQLGVFGMLPFMANERRLPLRMDKLSMNPLTALIMGFCFSFSWTPCIGPTLTGVLMMTAASGTQMKGYLLILVYTLGFVIPFLAVGLFTGTVLSFFKKHQKVVQYTVKIGGILLILMGLMIATGWMSNFSGLIASAAAEETVVQEEAPAPTETPDPSQIPAPDFTLVDQYGVTHTLSDYQGKVVFINFWTTWCTYCKQEMPEIEEIYHELGENQQDVVILSMVNPRIGDNNSADTATWEEIMAYMEENGYTFPVLKDETGEFFYYYGINSFPTTFLIKADGNVMGYVPGAMTKDIMLSVIDQTLAAYPVTPSVTEEPAVE